MKKKVVVTRPVPEECAKAYSDKFDLVFALSEEEIASNLKDAHALVSVGYPVTAELLAHAGSEFQVVGTCTVGYDHIDLAACNRMGYALVNAPREVTNPTGELTVGLILAVMRGLVRSDRKLRETLRVENPFFPEHAASLYGKTAGIVGFGRIGRTVAGILRAFGMEICYTDVARAPEEEEERYGARYLGFHELLSASDVVTLHCPYLPENHHIMNQEAFCRMKRTAYFINAARGKLMDEDALIWALEEGRIAGVGLDVYEYEPLVPSRLAAFENVVLVPHIGTSAYEVRVKMFLECMGGVAEIFGGRLPYNLVNRGQLL